MPGNGLLDEDSLSKYRAYLRVLAELELGRRGRLGAKLDPSDLVQDTLLRAIRAQDQLRATSVPEVLSWLRKILAHCMSNLLREFRAQRRDFRKEQSLEELLERSAERLTAAASKITPSPSSVCREEENLLEVLEAVAGLPCDQRQAFLLRHFLGLSVGEVSRDMCRTPASVAGLLRRAAGSLRKTLSQRPSLAGCQSPDSRRSP